MANTASEATRVIPQHNYLSGWKTKPEKNSLLDYKVQQIFGKSFQYQNKVSFILPTADELFKEFYQFETLKVLKAQLNEVKSRLNDYEIEDWSLHTNRKDPSGEISWRLKNETKPEFVTVAWCKFYECLGRFPQLIKGPHMNSLHLCEAPGAFIAALNHFLCSRYEKGEIQWHWLASTLNPYYEGNPWFNMITDDRFMLFTLDNWLFHPDFTGNIIDKKNLKDMAKQCLERLPQGEVHLITADGSVDCVESPDSQEEHVSLLHLSEITAALTVLASHGCLVMKMFTMFEASSVCILYLLNCVFETVHVTKPATSKRGNSEVYIVCLNYLKESTNLQKILHVMTEHLDIDSEQPTAAVLFKKSSLPKDFLMQHEICCRLFMNHQITAIENNIFTYELKANRSEVKANQLLRSLVCQEYYSRYNVTKVPEESKILYKFTNAIEKGCKLQIYRGSYTARNMLKIGSREEQIFKLKTCLNDIEKFIRNDMEYDALSTEFTQNYDCKLKVYKGKSIKKLCSSVFINVQLIIMRSKLKTVYHLEPLWLGQPKAQLKDELMEIYYPQNADVEDFADQQVSFFYKILNQLLVEQIKNLEFTDLPFTTHFAVSILKYLAANVFQTLTISWHPKFVIALKEPKGQYNEALKLLIETMKTPANAKDILCFIDIKELHRNEFNKSLVYFNNELLLHKYKFLLEL
uniref:Cap-specific mRNA (nucleoside-2'-O-)-methyltransferase 2 n=1 Tax=Glossina brevipalpis TaxID=37001 RepID=A0A1A9WYW9_9MUSC